MNTTDQAAKWAGLLRATAHGRNKIEIDADFAVAIADLLDQTSHQLATALRAHDHTTKAHGHTIERLHTAQDDLHTMTAELDAAEARYERARPVLDAALEWADSLPPPPPPGLPRPLRDLEAVAVSFGLQSDLLDVVRTFKAATEDQTPPFLCTECHGTGYDPAAPDPGGACSSCNGTRLAPLPHISIRRGGITWPAPPAEGPSGLSGQPLDPWALGCPTCTGPIRETVGLVCQTCGTDYGTPALNACEPVTCRTCLRPGCEGTCCPSCGGSGYRATCTNQLPVCEACNGTGDQPPPPEDQAVIDLLKTAAASFNHTIDAHLAAHPIDLDASLAKIYERVANATPEEKAAWDTEAAALTGDAWPRDDTGSLVPCQPIGCDNGHHLPGCPYTPCGNCDGTGYDRGNGHQAADPGGTCEPCQGTGNAYPQPGDPT